MGSGEWGVGEEGLERTITCYPHTRVWSQFRESEAICDLFIKGCFNVCVCVCVSVTLWDVIIINQPVYCND